jgi:hypothetical protein
MKARILSIQTLLYVALVLALLSSLKHVAFAFTTVNGNDWIEAYLSAIAIDVGLLALAAGINRRKSQKRNTTMLWVGIALFSLISVYANWLAGVVHVSQLSAKVSGFALFLANLRPILLSSVLPLLVIYLSEVATDNEEYAQQQEARAQKRSAKRRVATEIADVNAQRVASKKQKVAQLVGLLEATPDATNNELANQLQVSESTIRNYKAELATNGNGQVPK